MTVPVRVEVPVPYHGLPHRGARELLALARAGLNEAARTDQPAQRYATAHLAALRVAAALVADRATPAPPWQRHPATSVWALLTVVAPELTAWAGFFAEGTTRRAAVDAGCPSTVTGAEADAMVGAAGTFLALAETFINP